ncbi:MAG: hypothetical protein AAGH92_13360 [Planctomycetota bacterium]
MNFIASLTASARRLAGCYVFAALSMFGAGPAVAEDRPNLARNFGIAPIVLYVVGATLGPEVEIDGPDLLPILEDRAESGRESPMFELAYARAVNHSYWKYIPIRYLEAVKARIRSGERLSLNGSAIARFGLNGDETAVDRQLWFSQHQLAYAALHGWPNYFRPDQLYDLGSDLDDTCNLAGVEPESLAQMRLTLA